MMAPELSAVDRPEFKAESQKGVQFDAGTAGLKAVIEDLIEDVRVRKSLFFAFVLSEAISELEKRVLDLSDNQKPDVTPKASPSLPVQAT